MDTFVGILNRKEWPKNPDSTPDISTFSIPHNTNTGCEVRTACLSSGLKRPGRKADHLQPLNAKSKNTWGYTSNTWRGV